MMILTLVLSVVIPLAILVIVGRWMKAQFPRLAREALREMGQDFLTLAKGTLEIEREKGLHELDVNRLAVDEAVKGLEEQLKRYEAMVQDFESDRNQKFGRLEGELARVITGADKLQQTTAHLVAVLGNSRVRGQWGQKMANDILRACGLQEGIHYRQEQGLASGRPDYTFQLPDDHVLFMDVKFPLENYVKLVGSASEEEQRRYRDAFVRDVKDHLREMERRDYLAQADRTVDYLLLFIPNEQVYGMVNELMPGLIDEGLHKKMIVCGPWTLYAILRIIWQAWQHYHYSAAIQDIVKMINGFLGDYEKFKERFGELGTRLDETAKKYQEIAGASFRRLENKMQKIEDYRKGQQIAAAGSESDSEGLPQLTETGGRHD